MGSAHREGGKGRQVILGDGNSLVIAKLTLPLISED